MPESWKSHEAQHPPPWNTSAARGKFVQTSEEDTNDQVSDFFKQESRGARSLALWTGCFKTPTCTPGTLNHMSTSLFSAAAISLVQQPFQCFCTTVFLHVLAVRKNLSVTAPPPMGGTHFLPSSFFLLKRRVTL